MYSPTEILGLLAFLAIATVLGALAVRSLKVSAGIIAGAVVTSAVISLITGTSFFFIH